MDFQEFDEFLLVAGKAGEPPQLLIGMSTTMFHSAAGMSWDNKN